MSSVPGQSANAQCNFIGLITQHQASLRAYIISLMPGIEGASDLLQSTNLILWEKKESFQPGTNFIAWAFAIARYEVLNHKRKQQRQKPIISLDADLVDELAHYSLLPPEETELRLRALEHCLSKLSLDELELVQNRYASDTTLQRYAERIGRPFGSLRVTLHRIRSGLRKCIIFQLKLTAE